MEYKNFDFITLPDNYLELDLDEIMLTASDLFDYNVDEIEENPMLNEKKKEFNCNLSLL